jgi:glycerate dehydrogenase
MQKQSITILDGYTLNPGDLSWDTLRSLAPCDIHDRTQPQEILQRAAEASILLTNKVVINQSTLQQLPHLKYIGVLATGYNVVDIPAATQMGIAVTNVPAYSTASVAQLVFSLLFELTFQTAHHARRVREGAWSQCPDFTFRDTPLTELQGKSLGILGFGRIGRAVAKIGHALGMNVLVTTRTRPEASGTPIEYVSLDLLLRRSDVLSLHCPLTPATDRIINETSLAHMKPSAYLINTARGPLLDESAVARALHENRLAGAGLDVLSQEPPTASNPLLTAPRCLITPHIGWATLAARQRLMAEATNNVRAFLEGSPVNVVNPDYLSSPGT